jgi:thiamine-phosphate pyrophosphorylase
MNTAIQQLIASPLMLLFTPSLVPGVDSEAGAESDAEIGTVLGALEAALGARAAGGPAIGAVQLRIKGPKSGRALFTWGARLADFFMGLNTPPLLLVNDRVDVALALGRDVRGVHLGQTDLPIAAARQLLGAHALIGRSTHDFAQVLVATEEGANYLGFGPIHATATKGYERGLGSEPAWIAAAATSLPIFPIGGINATNAGELGEIGRAAISSAILSAPAPRQATAAIAALLKQAASTLNTIG